MRLGGVIVDHGRGLGAEVAGFRVEVQRADAVFTLRAGELHAALDALNFVGFHYLNCSPRQAGAGKRWLSSESNAIANPDLPRAKTAAELLHPGTPKPGLSGAPVRSAWTLWLRSG